MSQVPGLLIYSRNHAAVDAAAGRPTWQLRVRLEKKSACQPMKANQVLTYEVSIHPFKRVKASFLSGDFTKSPDCNVGNVQIAIFRVREVQGTA